MWGPLRQAAGGCYGGHSTGAQVPRHRAPACLRQRTPSSGPRLCNHSQGLSGGDGRGTRIAVSLGVIAPLLSLFTLVAGPAPDSPGLSEVLALHCCLDVDRNGELILAEAAPTGVDAAGFQRADGDGSGALSEGEFLVVICGVLRRRRQRAAPDLEAESLRVQALFRARRAMVVRGRLAAGRAVHPRRPRGLREVELEIRCQRLRWVALGTGHADARAMRAELGRLEARRMLLLRPPRCGAAPVSE